MDKIVNSKDTRPLLVDFVKNNDGRYLKMQNEYDEYIDSYKPTLGEMPDLNEINKMITNKEQLVKDKYNELLTTIWHNATIENRGYFKNNGIKFW